MNKEEIENIIKEDNCNDYFLINEILAIRDKRKETQDFTIYVYDRLIVDFIPPKTEIDYKVLSIWTTKSVEELKKGE